MIKDWVSFMAYPNLFGIKGFVVVVVVIVLLINLELFEIEEIECVRKHTHFPRIVRHM
jgi:hypothetical protein